ncbi:MFS transporter [Microvirga sp. W0021]|uniref:MFS transporter n=1 Tax=Hohaiivirga grylli TaxID=3133970 RepID=A0ABV0BFV3_9HYPH
MKDKEMRFLDSTFKRISWSNLFAHFSEQVALAAAPLVAVLVLGASASDTAFLQTSQTLPFLLLSIPIGLIVDRFSRRNLIIGAEVLRALSLSIIFLMLYVGGLSLPLLAVLGFIGTMGTVSYSVALPAYVPTIIPKEGLMRANQWLELARSIAFSGGPALGGMLVGYMGASSAYVFATVLSVFAAVLLVSLPEEAQRPVVQKRVLHDLMEGATFIIRHELLRPILLTAIFFNTSWFVVQGVYVAYAATNLSLSGSQIGLTIGIYGIGMVVGAMSLKYLEQKLSYGTMVVLGPLSGLLAAVLLLATVWFPSVTLAAAAYFFFGAGPTIWSITTMAIRQVVTPGQMMGRVSALILTVTFGARPLGSVIAAMLALQFGVESCLWLAVAGFIVQFVIILLSTVPSLKALPATA